MFLEKAKPHPNRSRAQVRRWARERSLRAPRIPGPRDAFNDGRQRNEARPCDVDGCRRLRLKVSRYCREHGNRNAGTGHPVYLNIRLGVWRPFVAQAKAFVVDQLRAGHPSIEEGVRWIATEMANAERPTSPDPTHLLYQAYLLRSKSAGIEPVDLLARVIAAHLADDRFTGEPGPRFGSDQHFAHQLARLYLHPVPFGSPPRWADGWGKYNNNKREPIEPSNKLPRLRWRVRAYTYDRIRGALGILALRAAPEIQKRQRNPER